MLKNLATSVLRNEVVKTTHARAKETQRVVDWIVTWGKTDSPHTRALASSIVKDARVVDKVFDVLGPRYLARPGGYTRVMRVGQRRGDAAQMSVVELVDRSGTRFVRPKRWT